MSRLPLIVLRIAMSAILGVLLSACGAPEGAEGLHGFPPAEVSVVTVQPHDVPLVFEHTGQISGSREVEIRARVNGILLKRHFEEGRRVKQGELLYTIDAAPFAAAAARAEADLAAANARAEQAARSRTRLAPLHEARAISQKEYDDAVSAELVAKAEAKAAKARLDEANLQLSYTRIESPIDGVAGRSLKSEGSLISGPDVLLTNITQVNPIYVNFGISENEHLKLRQEVEQGRVVLPRGGLFDVVLKLADGSLYEKRGRLTFSDVRLSPETGTSEARADVPNPKGELRPGQFVRVILHGARRPKAMTVPTRAVLEGPQGKFVYVVNNENNVEPRPVQVGDWSGDNWVVHSGLQAGDRVIVDNLMKIGPGAPVIVAAPASDAATTSTNKPN
jgi:membrane fusion protein, multidrug efflux system